MPKSYEMRKNNRKLYKYTLMLDEVSIICAFFSAFAIRYNAIVNWVDKNTGIYVSMIVTVFLFNIIIFTFYDKKNPTIVQMDPFDNLVKLCKNRALLSLLTIMYFYVSYKSVLASRIVMGLFLVLSAIYGYVFRMIYRKIYICSLPTEEDKTYRMILPVDNLDGVIREIKKGDYESVILRAGDADSDYIKSVLKKLEKNGIRTFITLESLGYEVRSGIATNMDSYMVIPAYIRPDRFNLWGVNFCVAKTEEAVHHVIDHLNDLKGRYICFSNVHTSVMAKESRDYANVLNSAALVFPDGSPVTELQKKRGFYNAERVAGPDFMEHMFRDTMDGSISHYFYGSSEETLSALKENLNEKYPGLNIKGMYSPPFRDITPEEDQEDIKRINESGADILWVGLGAPKQEKWMNAHQGKLNAVMMGVGAGFDFHAGTINRAPVWLQKIGLEWLYRLFKDPKRLFKRYFITNLKFVFYIFTGNI